MTEQETALQQQYLTLSGQGFKRLALAGMAWLEQHYQVVNQLNVFPVPDGDTGINMLLTMQSAYAEIADDEDDHLGNIVRKFAKGAVNGSRGNSGVILSQIWRGFSTSLRELHTMDAAALAAASSMGVSYAYDAAPKPAREGTILTVAREVSEAVQAAFQNTNDLGVLLARMVEQAWDALSRTPEMLPVLKEAGVVDSGGQGLTYILEGMLLHLRGETIETQIQRAAVPARKPARVMSATEFGHPYDVQFLLSGGNLDEHHIRAAIAAMGDSAIVTSDGVNTLKVHVHVYDPGQPISYAAKLGVISDVVVENMYQQYLENVGANTTAPAPTVVLESDDVAVVAVAPGEGLARVFYEQGAARLISGGQTMNPSTEEIFAAIRDVPTDKVIVLPNNANVILTAEQAVKKAKGKTVRVVKSTNLPQGISAMIFYANARLREEQRKDLDYIATGMSEALNHVVSGEVTTAVRSATLDGVRAQVGQLIGLLDDRLIVAGDDMAQVMHDLIAHLDADSYELVTLYYGAEVKPADALALAEYLASRYDAFSFEVVPGGQPHYHYLLSAE